FSLRPLSTPLDELLTPAPPRLPVERTTLPFRDERAIIKTRESGATLFDGVTFAFDALDLDTPRLGARIGSYFDHMATCVALEWELLEGGATPHRDALHAVLAPSDVMTSGAGRSAAIGVNTLVVYRDENAYYALIGQRSNETAHKPGALHVLPAFTFQPSQRDYPYYEWGLTYHIIREYLEELYGVPEAEQGTTPSSITATEHPAKARLHDMVRAGAASLELTGMTCNLMTTHVSVCVLLLIHAPSWVDDYREQSLTWETQTVYEVPIATDSVIVDTLPHDAYLNFAPNGASAFWLGVDRARERLGLL
ncbi:MAG: hypothetical protein AAF125_07705, partial [Chloroflexota bacterium]